MKRRSNLYTDEMSLYLTSEQRTSMRFVKKVCCTRVLQESGVKVLQRLFNSDFYIQLGMVCLQQNQKGSLAEGRAKCFTADSAQKLGSKTMLTNGQLNNESDRSKYPVKLLLILDFNSYITLGQIGIWETHFT